MRGEVVRVGSECAVGAWKVFVYLIILGPLKRRPFIFFFSVYSAHCENRVCITPYPSPPPAGASKTRQAMSGGSDTISANSLFTFDDSFGDGKDCLHAATVLKTLCPRLGGRGGGGHTGTATMNDFLRVAGALKTLAAVREIP